MVRFCGEEGIVLGEDEGEEQGAEEGDHEYEAVV